MAAGPNGSPGINKMCRAIAQRVNRSAENIEQNLVLDIGTIQSDMSLMTNTFPKKIKKGDYHVCRHVNGFRYKTDRKESSHGEHGGHVSGSGTHSHWVKPPELMKGDKVLVAWVQNEVIVIDVIDTTEANE